MIADRKLPTLAEHSQGGLIAPTRRPRFQFRLSTLLWITLAVATFFAGMVVQNDMLTTRAAKDCHSAERKNFRAARSTAPVPNNIEPCPAHNSACARCSSSRQSWPWGAWSGRRRPASSWIASSRVPLSPAARTWWYGSDLLGSIANGRRRNASLRASTLPLPHLRHRRPPNRQPPRNTPLGHPARGPARAPLAACSWRRRVGPFPITSFARR